MSDIGLGIIGVGRHGSRYAGHAARDIDGLRLAAVSRRDSAAGRTFADELGASFYASPFDLIKDTSVDAVAIVTAPYLIEDLANAVMDEGKALIIEKPVALNLETGRRLLDRIEQTQTHCLVGHTLRFNTVCRALRNEIPTLGRLDTMIFSQRFPPQLHLDWLDTPSQSGGGNILHTGVHCFDLIRFLSGQNPVSVHCRTRRIYTQNTEDDFTAQIELDGSATAIVACARTTQSRNGLIEFVGENGQLVGDHVHNTLYRIDAGGTQDLALESPRHTVLETLKSFQVRYQASEPPEITYEDGLFSIATASACYESAVEGGRNAVVPRITRP